MRGLAGGGTRATFGFRHGVRQGAGRIEAGILQAGPATGADGDAVVSWPKKSSGVATDLNENDVRKIGLEAGLVDVKVCAVSEIWSGLKFVIRVKDRSAR